VSAPTPADRDNGAEAGLVLGTTQRLLVSIAESTGASVFVKDRQGRYLMVNDRACELFGHERGQMLGADDTALFPPDVARAAIEVDREILAGGAPRTGELVITSRVGPRTVKLTRGPIADDHGQVVGVFGIAHDITDTKAEDDALLLNRARVRTILENESDLVLELDREGRVEFASRFPTGVAREAVIGARLEEWLSEEQKGVLRDALATVFRTGERQSYRAAAGAPGDTERIYEVRLAPVGQQGAILIASDISERERAEARARMLMHSIDVHMDGAYFMDPDGRFVYVNAAACQVLGYEREQLLRMTVFDVNPSMTPERFGAVWERLRRDGAYRAESTHRRADGSEFPVEIATTHVRYGTREYACGFARDISERRSAERALRESEALFAKTFQSAPVFMVVATLDDGTIVRVNDAALRLSGCRRDEVIGRNSLELGWISAEQRQAFAETVRKNGRVAGLEATVRTKDEREAIVQLHAERIELGGQQCVLTVALDVTDQRRAERDLRMREERFRALIEHSSDAVTLLAADGTVLYDSPSMTRVLGYGPTERLGHQVFDYMHPDDRKSAAAGFARFAEQRGGVAPSSVRFFHKDGTLLDIEGVRTNLLHEPAVGAVVVNYRDVSARKRVEAQRLELERRLLHAQKLESLGVLAGGIAHDFNNLLMSIVGNLDLALLDIGPDSPARTGIEQGLVATRRAADLTRQMLAYSGKGRFVALRMDLTELVRENADLFRTVTPRTASLTTQWGSAPVMLEADPGQVQQVVMNLITNASEALEGRPGVITLSTGLEHCDDAYLARSRVDPVPAPGLYAYVEVADTGCGMDPETLARLFDPFFTTKFTGRGLGLAAVLGIVRGHGGAILVDSAPGAGTTIRALFPACSQSLTQAALVGEGSGRNSEPSPQAHAVLVVDDEDAVLRPCCELVRRLGYHPVPANSGHQALALMQDGKSEFDCVLLDLTMPLLDGAATFREMRRLGLRVPVILVSGYSEDAALVEFGQERPVGFIQKPFRLDALRQAIAGALNASGPDGE
jgi:two-component system, cell cycle sensor histidine kinase and response regulator CckA